MASIWRQIISRTVAHSHPASLPSFLLASSRFFSKSSPYVVKVGIPEFLNGIGKGVEAHVEKLETEFGSDLQKLLVARTLKLKKLEIPCKHVANSHPEAFSIIRIGILILVGAVDMLENGLKRSMKVQQMTRNVVIEI